MSSGSHRRDLLGDLHKVLLESGRPVILRIVPSPSVCVNVCVCVCGRCFLNQFQNIQQFQYHNILSIPLALYLTPVSY